MSKLTATVESPTLFPIQDLITPVFEPNKNSSTFLSNMRLPVHRWFRYSAGFSGDWAQKLITESSFERPTRVLDPFVGSGTTLIAAEMARVESCGLESHPFVFRVATAKLDWRSSAERYLNRLEQVKQKAKKIIPEIDGYPNLIRRCFNEGDLIYLDKFRRAWEKTDDNSPESRLVWITLVSILRKISTAGTAQWQYILPKKTKFRSAQPEKALADLSAMIHEDILSAEFLSGPKANLYRADAREWKGDGKLFNLVVTSPPYPNNYDYADATRLEMSFFQEINGWGDLQESVRQFLVRSCSQHVPEKSMKLQDVLSSVELDPIRQELKTQCERLEEIRKTKGGKKTYHLMAACYFRDLALVWKTLRAVTDTPSKVCFVVGDSAPYGIYLSVIPWLGKLALAAGFKSYRFEKIRDRNIKWKNRKHRVPLQEGFLWVEG